ncbi:MAG: hypothetical protein Q8M98_11435 [Candidatus Cloacimonadaceae bacterium]|nr:hypothetical protein [Candidatus Cloacimonadaceae bacterium]MDP3115362.1 hypothetical protein [Candidatus Cloacimonadaceae bacterium]
MKICLFMLTLMFCTVLIAQQPALPIREYDYAIPENNVSPMAIGLGGMNITNGGDYYGSYSNPALLADNQISALVTSFRVADEKAMGFWEATQISNALKPKQFKYFSLVTKQAAWTYQPVASVHISEITAGGDSSRYYDYQLDKVQMSLAAKDDSWQSIRAGINIKYLTGRLVYLKEHRVGSNLVRDAFIDDKVKGFSTDVGLTMREEDFTFGLTAYDLFSRLYWENYDSKPIQRRVALGVQYASGSSILMGGVQGKTSKQTDTSIHFGFQNTWSWGSQNLQGDSTSQGLVLRLGLYSQDFYGTSNINYTLGSGYNYNVFRFDFSMNNRGMKLRESEYLFSLGIGLP